MKAINLIGTIVIACVLGCDPAMETAQTAERRANEPAVTTGGDYGDEAGYGEDCNIDAQDHIDDENNGNTDTTGQETVLPPANDDDDVHASETVAPNIPQLIETLCYRDAACDGYSDGTPEDIEASRDECVSDFEAELADVTAPACVDTLADWLRCMGDATPICTADSVIDDYGSEQDGPYAPGVCEAERDAAMAMTDCSGSSDDDDA